MQRPVPLMDSLDASVVSSLIEDFRQEKINKFKIITSLKKIKNKGLLRSIGRSLSFKSLFKSECLTSPSNIMLLNDLARVLYCGRKDIDFDRYGFIMSNPNDILKNSQDRWDTNKDVDLNNFTSVIKLEKEILDDMNNPGAVINRLRDKDIEIARTENSELHTIIYNIGINKTLFLFKLLGYINVITPDSISKVTEIK